MSNIKIKHELLVGKKVNRLMVKSVDYTRNSSQRAKNRRIYYICECECGIISSVRKEYILDKRTVSCGCFQKEKAAQRGKRLPDGEVPKKKYYKSYIRGAAVRNLEFKLTFEEFLEITSKKCYYCNRLPQPKCGNKKFPSDIYICNGIDRLNNSEGYVAGNVYSCCYRCNSWKSNLTLSEFILPIKEIANNFSKYDGTCDTLPKIS